ncbi:cyclic GMP-AMP synthase [Osmerus mordax]|uniref:cyclic GMP-AMP synthase n=1 Tax=Osmerus mordax TaxID=8014 RepID=UPI00350ECDE5
MKRNCSQRRSVKTTENTASSTPTPPYRPINGTSLCPPDQHPSLVMEAGEGECQEGEVGSSNKEASLELNENSTPPPTPTSKPRQRPQQTIQLPTIQKDTPTSQELLHRIKLRVRDLVIPQSNRKWAVELVNDLRDNLLDFLKNNDEQPFFQSADWLTSGSYYETVKIDNPNEFDMMVKLQSPSRLNWTELDQYQGLFYEVALSRPTRSNIRPFLLENSPDGLTISSSKILSEMHRLVRKFICTYKVPGGNFRWVVNKKKVYCPAVTLSLSATHDEEELLSVDVVPALEAHPSQKWPQPARNGLNVDNWLGKKTRQTLTSKTFYFVPKRPKGRNLSPAAKESWRISFSHIEKEIIKLHGNKKTCCETTATKCCRKTSFRLLKCLIEALKRRFPQELDSLCSYHGKTAFFHILSLRGQDTQWLPQQLPSCFMHLFGAFEDHARSGILPHFFIPACNLFSPPAFPRKALSFLTSALEEQKRLNLPLFMPQAPSTPLALHVSPDNPDRPDLIPLQSQLPPTPPRVLSFEVTVKIILAVILGTVSAIYIL